MKKKTLRLLCTLMLIMIMGTNVAYAKEPFVQENNVTGSEDDAIQPMSLYLASGISEITNMGNGILHIYADFASHQSVPWAQLTIKLERATSADSNNWSRVKTYTFEFNAKDEPDGSLTFGYADFDVSGYATNYYYRLTTTHKVKTPSGSYESKTSGTNGVLLTSYPDFRSPAKPN